MDYLPDQTLKTSRLMCLAALSPCAPLRLQCQQSKQTKDSHTSLYKEIRLSDITRKLDFPIEREFSLVPSYLQQIEYLRSEIIRINSTSLSSGVREQYTQYYVKSAEENKQAYIQLELKYNELIRENLSLQSEVGVAQERVNTALESQLSEANSKISVLMLENEAVQRNIGLKQRDLISLQTRLDQETNKLFRMEGDYQIVLTEKLRLQQLIDKQYQEKASILTKHQGQLSELRRTMQENKNTFWGQRHTITSLLALKETLSQDVEDARNAYNTLKESVRTKNEDIVTLEVSISLLKQQKGALQKQIETKDKLFSQIRMKFQQERVCSEESFRDKTRLIACELQQTKLQLYKVQKESQSLKSSHDSNLSTVCSLQSQIASLRDFHSRLELQNTKLQSQLFSSRVFSDQSRRQCSEVSRLQSEVDFNKAQVERLKQEIAIINRKNKQLQHNYRTLIDNIKEENRTRESMDSHAFRRSISKSKQPRHLQDLNPKSILRQSSKSKTETVEQLIQYRSTIESKLGIREKKTEGANEAIMKRCKLILNR